MLAAITLFGSGRLGPTLTAVLGLVGVIIGARTFAAARRNGDPTRDPRRRAALLLGLAALLLGVVFLAAADGGPGSGDGVVGSAAAIVLGLVAIGFDRSAAKHRSRTPSAGAHVA
jgi:hypothetical protein